MGRSDSRSSASLADRTSPADVQLCTVRRSEFVRKSTECEGHGRSRWEEPFFSSYRLSAYESRQDTVGEFGMNPVTRQSISSLQRVRRNGSSVCWQVGRH